MATRIGDKIPRKLIISLWVYILGAFGALTAITASLGMHDWVLPAVVGGIAVVLLALPNLTPPGREFVQIDDSGVAVATKKGEERVLWSELERVRILTTDSGPWTEDVFFLLEAPGGKGCAVPHSAAVRTQLLEELQSRLKGVRDDQVIEAMGSSTNKSFTIWERLEDTNA